MSSSGIFVETDFNAVRANGQLSILSPNVQLEIGQKVIARDGEGNEVEGVVSAINYRIMPDWDTWKKGDALEKKND